MLLPEVSTVANVIYRQIRTDGPLPFVRFMELALYCPELGFYERFPHRIGRAGHFYTSVGVGPIFGHLLAFRFARWLTAPGLDGEHCQLLEAGVHDGQLALDILTWLQQHAPARLQRLEYLILEPSPRRESWQRAKLREMGHAVKWIRSWSDLRAGAVQGVIFSNELLDAFPVHRFGWDARARQWFEYGVDVQHGRLAWCRLPSRHDIDPGPPEVPEPLAASLPDGFVVEAAPGAQQWWRDAAVALGRGRLVTLDYGLDRPSALDPTRPEGTLRGYVHHQRVTDLLANPGEQDLTAHVDFHMLREAGEAAGLHTCALMDQGRFLTSALEEAIRLQSPGFTWSSRERSQFQTLAHPDHLGARFKVLVQGRE
jgi:SAM-dependent MidA family methyltransferase